MTRGLWSQVRLTVGEWLLSVAWWVMPSGEEKLLIAMMLHDYVEDRERYRGCLSDPRRAS